MKYIKGFDGLRGLSILMVLQTHLGFGSKLFEYDFITVRTWMLFSGNTGVQIFFTLSGFLITSILLSEKLKHKVSLKNFYIRRFLRLLPPLIIFYVIIALLMKFDLISYSLAGFAYSFFYLYNFVPKEFYISELGHTWSLAVEEQFYLTWPFIIYYLKTKSIVAITLFVILLCTLFLIVYNEFEFIKNGFNPLRWFIPAVGPVIIGSLLAIVNSSFSSLKSFLKPNIYLFPMSILLFLCPLYLPNSLLLGAYLIQSLGVALFLLWIFHNQDSVLVSILNFKYLNYIGKISYGLYVFQGLFLRTGPGGTLSFQQFPYHILFTFIVAILSYELIEKRVLKLKVHFK
ncbi:acyltransferase family protein [Geojedonia litorea]|uniref:Acyltransferase family protein n=1 Tax=Geojedonia litorea TaxID=1268269 RepID=A0ABV9MYV9_9FLAO